MVRVTLFRKMYKEQLSFYEAILLFSVQSAEFGTLELQMSNQLNR